jgi:hypothetical protein
VTSLRRLRGGLLRLIRRRPLAVALGAILVVPSAWIELGGHATLWWAQGSALIGGATGLALLWTGLTGPSPDWVE